MLLSDYIGRPAAARKWPPNPPKDAIIDWISYLKRSPGRCSFPINRVKGTVHVALLFVSWPPPPLPSTMCTFYFGQFGQSSVAEREGRAGLFRKLLLIHVHPDVGRQGDTIWPIISIPAPTLSAPLSCPSRKGSADLLCSSSANN